MVQKDASRDSTQSVIKISSYPRIKTNIEKVTAVLFLRSWDAVPLGQVVPRGPVPGGYWSHNFAKNHRLDLKMSCIDASRRQLQSVREIRV
jgi:hypothetical protein